MSTSHRILKLARQIHLYIGLFISPAILFFAFTGALQTFNLHENSHTGGSYKPPTWIVTLSQIHKKQTTTIPVAQAAPRRRRAQSREAEKHDDQPARHHASPTRASRRSRHMPMKIFFLLVAIGLFTSTLTGIYMSYKFLRNKFLVTALLLAGIIIPIILLRF